MNGTRQQDVAVLSRQMGCELDDAREMQPAVAQHGEEDRVPTSRSSRVDAQVGFRLGEVKDLGTVRVHRRRGLPRIEPARVDRADVINNIGLYATRVAEQL